jgi:hypothetical protein
VQEAFADSIVDTLLITGGTSDRWSSICAEDPRFVRVVKCGKDEVYLLRGNVLPTDSLLRTITQKLGQEW